ncbi:MAG: hypothetical protein ACK54C_01340, partial [Betaproteobacteria bacterium]
MWLYPRGLQRTSNTKTPFNRKRKYGSVVVTVYEDQKNKVYYHQDINSPSILWAKLGRARLQGGLWPSSTRSLK